MRSKLRKDLSSIRGASIVLVSLIRLSLCSALFMAGSPLAMFMFLEQRQLIARKGRPRTKNSPHDEAVCCDLCV